MASLGVSNAIFYIKILGQIQHYSATLGTAPEHLPPDSTWWFKVNGQLVQDPLDSSRYLLDQTNLNLRAHVANQAKALMDTGNFDGIMLDTCRTFYSYPNYVNYPQDLIQDVRNKIGNNALIIINVNANVLSATQLAPVNGVFIESGFVGIGSNPPSWQTVMAALDNNEKYTRAPRVNCLQDWASTTSPTDVNDLTRMRAITTLSLTHSNGYVNFGRVQYYWYSFWSDHTLGVPIATTGQLWHSVSTYGHQRDFQNGCAVWNSSTTNSISVTFPEQRKRLGTGQIKPAWQPFVIAGADGDIFLSKFTITSSAED